MAERGTGGPPAPPYGAAAMTVRIRQATAVDLPAIKAMVQEFVGFLNAIDDDPEDVGIEMLDRLDNLAFGPAPLCSILLAERDGHLAGYLVCFPGVFMDRVVASLHIADLFVREPDRRHGVGRALMEGAAAFAADRDIRTLFWTVWRKNPGAMQFYERLGASFVDEERLMMWAPASD